MFSSYLQQVQQQKPLVHCITNYVTVNDCANMVLACGQRCDFSAKIRASGIAPYIVSAG